MVIKTRSFNFAERLETHEDIREFLEQAAGSRYSLVNTTISKYRFVNRI